MIDITAIEELLIDSKINASLTFYLMVANGIIFLPPSEIVLFKVSQQITNELFLPVYAFLGTWIAGLFMYYLSIYLTKRKLASAYIEKIQVKASEYIPQEKNLFWPLLYGRITPGIRSQVPVFVAIMNINFTTFILAHTIGSIIWVAYWILISLVLIEIGQATELSNKYIFMLILFFIPIIHYWRKILDILNHIIKHIRP